MPKAKFKPKTGIYHPPKKGMPYMVVTIASEGITAIPCQSKDDARILAAKKTLNEAPQQDDESRDLSDEASRLSADEGC